MCIISSRWPSKVVQAALYKRADRIGEVGGFCVVALRERNGEQPIAINSSISCKMKDTKENNTGGISNMELGQQQQRSDDDFARGIIKPSILLQFYYF